MFGIILNINIVLNEFLGEREIIYKINTDFEKCLPYVQLFQTSGIKDRSEHH